MAYFSNGTEGMDYQDQWCARCIHDKDQNCPIWDAHLTHNHAECNKADSILHMLIPRSENGLANEMCLLFIENPASGDMFPSEAA